MLKLFILQTKRKPGGKIETVELVTHFQTVKRRNVILMDLHLAVLIVNHLASVVILRNTVLVTAVQTTNLLRSGGNQEAHKCGEMTESVVEASLCRTVRILDVILKERTLVVVVDGMESVVTLQNIALVTDVQTTSLQRSGGNQEEHKS